MSTVRISSLANREVNFASTLRLRPRSHLHCYRNSHEALILMLAGHCRYSRGGGVIAWRNSIMLFVNAEPASQAKYANKFLEGGRRLVWFPAPGQTQHHPLIKRMLHATNAQHQQASKQQVSSHYIVCCLACWGSSLGQQFDCLA